MHVVAEPSLKRPPPHGWQAVDVPSMKYWLVPQQVLVPLVRHRFDPVAQEPEQELHEPTPVAPAPLKYPAGHDTHAVAPGFA